MSLLSLLLLFVACSNSNGEDTATLTDSDTADDGYFLDGDTGQCSDVPVVTWSTFGQGFMDFYCQGCHASTTQNRHDAPESVVFDNEEDCIDQAGRILARSIGPNPTMPPSGGVIEDDLYLLEVWLTCWI